MQIRSILSRVLLTLIFAAGALTLPASAQDDAQAYKKAFNTALAVAKKGQAAANSGDASAAIAHFADSYSQLNDVADEASAANDDGISRKAQRYAAKIAYTAGRVAMKSDQNAEAIKHFQAGYEIDETYPKNLLGVAKARQAAGDLDAAMATYAKAIEAGEAQGEYKIATSAREAIRSHYGHVASRKLSAENVSNADAEVAIAAIEKLNEYLDLDADSYYYLSVAAEAKSQYDKSVEYANKALELHNGSRTDKAKIYFVKGRSLMKLGDHTQARAALENATYGEYEAPAQHFINKLGNTR